MLAGQASKATESKEKGDLDKDKDMWLERLQEATKREEMRQAPLDVFLDVVTMPIRIPIIMILPNRIPDCGGKGGIAKADSAPGPGLESSQPMPFYTLEAMRWPVRA